MSDPSETSSPKAPGTYRTCTACHCRVHRDLEICPECGAHPGEHDAPQSDARVRMILSSILLLILAGALFLLSQNREEARSQELATVTLLAPEHEATTTGPEPAPDPQTPLPAATEVIPTPVPTPTPPPVPSPSPTPPPFQPEDLGLEPEQQVPVEPTPTPAPPTPTPVPSILDRKDQVKAEMRQELDRRLPLAQTGDVLNLTLRNNREISGTLLQLQAQQFQLETSTGAQWIPYRQLSPQSRLRLDPSERDTWLEERALEQVLKEL